MRPLRTAAVNAAIAPIAELSTSDVQPFTKGTIMVAKMIIGNNPARNRRIFSACGISRSLAGNTGPKTGLMRQRTTM